MTLFDPLIETAGEDITLEKVTSAVYDAWDNLDEDNSTIETTTLKAIKRRPEEMHDRAEEARLDKDRAVFVVTSTADVSAQREGRPDRITDSDGNTYQVEKVETDESPIGSAEKVTVTAEPLPGR